MTEPNIPRPKSEPSMMEAALRYLERGWNVIPVTRDKRPYLEKWEEYQQRMATEQEIKKWWGRWPTAGIAILTGALSGIVVIDADDAAGLESVKPYITQTTLAVITGRGGKHYYFKHPGAEVPCTVRFLPGVDSRGDSGYVVAPPSMHRSGRRYQWEGADLVNIPPKLLQLLQRGQQSHKLEAEDWKTDIPDGERDRELTRRAGRLLQMGIPRSECLVMLQAINTAHCKPPLGYVQVAKIIKSIAGREATKQEQKAPTAARFTVLTQKEMLRQYSADETRWMVAEWLPEASCGLLVAPPGNYKTWILSALGFSVATGRPFLGRYPITGRGPVLFIQQEDPWGMLQSRLACMFPQKKPVGDSKGPYELDCRFVQEFDEIPIYWYTDRRLSFADKAALAGMEQKIVELRPRLVMIDPLYTAVDTKDYMAEGAQRMLALKLMRDKYGCSFVIAHHTTVSGSASADRSSIWGSQFLNAWLEFGWRLPEGDEKGNTIIRHFKSCEDPKRIHAKFTITDWSFDVEIDEKFSESISERMEEMILSGGDPKSIRAIAKKVGCSISTAHEVIRKMGLKKDKEGYYRTPSEQINNE